MSGWREIHGDQNLRMAAKMLEQQGEVNDLRKRVSELEAQRDAVLTYLDDGNYGAIHELHDAIRNIFAGKEQREAGP